MNRRTFAAGSLGLAAARALPMPLRDKHKSDVAGELPNLELTLTDTGFEIRQPLQAGRYQITVKNTGKSETSHVALGKIPDRVTDAQFEEWLQAEDDTEALSFEEIAFVGMPDWPPPGGSVSGIVDIEPGRNFLFDPISDRQWLTLIVEGDKPDVPEPPADFTVVLHEMEIELPAAAATTKRMRWRIENTGAISHEVAVIPVSPEFTAEHLQMLFDLPEDATPLPNVPEFVYQPVAAIGILAGQHTSWLDVHLTRGRYLAACMLPFGTGYPHAMDGMYLFFDIE